MQHLWAPWRMKYIEHPRPETSPGCIFCDKPGAGEDRENLILFQGSLCFVLMNLFPYNNGHLLVVPRRHTADLTGLLPEEQSELMALICASARILADVYNPDGCNMGMNLGRVAGAGIAEHLHAHLVPRWNGDTNFMPVLAETRVLPESLFDSYDRLRPCFDALRLPM